MKNENGKKLNRKGIVLLAIIILVVIIVVISIGMQKNDKNEDNQKEENNEIMEEIVSQIDMNNTENVKIEGQVKTNISEELLKSKVFKNIQITDIELVAEDGISFFAAKVTNTGTKDFAKQDVILKFLNSEGNSYIEIAMYIPELKAKETSSINASTSSDLTNAYNFIIEEAK